MLFKYMPVLRTRAAEIIAYDHLEDTHKNQILPIFELTRSRRTRSDGQGEIIKNISKIQKMVGDRLYGLDLTGADELQNASIVSMLGDGANSFDLWVNFVSSLDCNNIIPAIHYDDSYAHLIKNQIERLRKTSKFLLFRLPVDEFCRETLRNFCSKVENARDVILLLDGRYIDARNKEKRKNDKELFKEVCATYPKVFHSISYSSSSFPRSVVAPGYGGDTEGFFELPETCFYDELVDCKGSVASCYSDYATVHPVSYPGGAGGWVPRVDYPRGKDLFYCRYRRDDGGYVRAASKVKSNSMYINHGDWGCGEIESAAAGVPNGRSPAHWISVRMSLHMARQVERLQSINSGLELSVHQRLG